MLSLLSESSLGDVFVANRAQLMHVARRIVRTADLADDVVQDAYLRIADGACDRKVDKPMGYCCQVVRNLALDHCRRQSLEATYRTFDVDIETLDVPGPPSPDRLMRDRQVVRLIDQVLSRLPERTRLAFQLYRLEGLTQRDIAVQLGCALGLVNRLIAEADEAIGTVRYLMAD
ncbi:MULTISPECIES: sigma-70 family RNA polymerase sigma factor [unclassified Variovorax]|uniref:sigma-70 family RNA polymerase sigma factor n=1 Tax=unclassified Variovorax TaxID=663243 RepID=UPI003F472312